MEFDIAIISTSKITHITDVISGTGHVFYTTIAIISYLRYRKRDWWQIGNTRDTYSGKASVKLAEVLFGAQRMSNWSLLLLSASSDINAYKCDKGNVVL